MAERNKVHLSVWFAIRMSVVWLWPASFCERGWSLTSRFIHSQLVFHGLELLRSTSCNLRSLQLQRESTFLTKYTFAVVEKHWWKFRNNKKKTKKKNRRWFAQGTIKKRWKLRLNFSKWTSRLSEKRGAPCTSCYCAVWLHKFGSSVLVFFYSCGEDLFVLRLWTRL